MNEKVTLEYYVKTTEKLFFDITIHHHYKYKYNF